MLFTEEAFLPMSPIIHDTALFEDGNKVRLDDNVPVELEQAWNTLYNVLHLNRLQYDPEDSVRYLRHPLIVILEHLAPEGANAPIEASLDYVIKNEVLLFLAQSAIKSELSKDVKEIIYLFFAYFIQLAPARALKGDDCKQTISILFSDDRKELLQLRVSIASSLIGRMNECSGLVDAYICDSLVYLTVEHLLNEGDHAVFANLAQYIIDYDYADLPIVTKTLAIKVVEEAMMEGREGWMWLQYIDNLFAHGRWEQLRIALVETIKTVCIEILAETNASLLIAPFKVATQPDLAIPFASRIITEFMKRSDWDTIEMIALRMPDLVFNGSALHAEFGIEKNELLAVLDRHPRGEEYYKKALEINIQERILKPGLSKMASQSKIAENSALERLLLSSLPLPICMPATPAICAFYLRAMQQLKHK